MKFKVTIFEVNGGQIDKTINECAYYLNTINTKLNKIVVSQQFKHINPEKQTISPYIILPYSSDFINYEENVVILFKLKNQIYMKNSLSPTSFIFVVIGQNSESYFEQLRFVIMTFGKKETLSIFKEQNYLKILKDRFKNKVKIEEGIDVRV